MKKITVLSFKEMKKRGEKITLLTCYDYSTARLLNEAGIDAVLVGDSLGMVKLGYENTLPVTIDDMVYHTKSVKRGNSTALLIADMPFMSYELSVREAISNAGRLLKEGGAEAVKVEGGKEMSSVIKALTDAKIPVMGHIGLTPQAVNKFGGYRVQGKNSRDASKLIADAKSLEKAGVFAIVLECIPSKLAARITRAVSVPTIGIGAGVFCGGQVLVTDDMLGLYSEIKPKFVKSYSNLRPRMLEAFAKYKDEVKDGKFPSKEYSY
ncbi:MAG TPA: 3-methyl-2-oxobutanoate hydroxymethyltransferase [Elusimicrobia bacterium]|nr:MAG: 3-methyl-2-oxobutanoate hydroxymethyltransferase [Elusimicrobia bacterium RIFOXYA12_FULL_49_49]OGS09319.1 MAG: 3-methyl-2-oxobutanoate hydroxymethyltransferase [Elusimicrobia bacterium RIFOXYB1_FULL_48_9]OGS16202.1 MAG: 3-methyl-2-oxobutanoate hydroxymethyltransferase [Elusimicrobia bacterium RIFOXYA2_FULL_47_53]OGS26599.1 MAG: 3-methyl-2-oxobutanoate hydroxymethyltransferase [Elusimicrobia bacterium RIFOXYB12_FULL_50_12]OGS31356.1 MAG: 3-methyl-2-oxobutanoate hydroxymethyltransferase [